MSSNLRRGRDGRPMEIVELKCPVCKLTILTSQAEATPPKQGLMPYCSECWQRGNRVVLRRREYRSGPPDLIV